MLTRRQFLQQTAATAALAALPSSSRAGGAGISLGFSLYGMKTVPLDDALRTCAEIGYRNVEFALNPGFPTEPKLLSAEARKNLRSRLASLRLDLSALMLNISLTADDAAHAKNLDALKAAVQLAQDLAPQQPPVVETVLGGKPAEWDNVKDRMAERLQSWAAVATAGRTTLAIKAHVGNAVNSPERLLWLIEKAHSPAVKATYDYSHFQLAGIPLADSLKALLPQTRFIHLKDATGDAKKFQFLLPGEGKTDYATYFKLLKQFGYSGPVVVEVSGQIFNKLGYDANAAAKKCFAVLSAALARA
ncbi:MAG: sugar phosphate isomerase/epimerase [Verrucomicrobia bacterium]|nr:sugar phosphate isomerase/epimerase [Verrucomicrobiota bacterium]